MWGLTEVNVTYANPNREVSGTGNPSFLGGQFIAEAYGIGMKFGAFTVWSWCISETDHVSTDLGTSVSRRNSSLVPAITTPS